MRRGSGRRLLRRMRRRTLKTKRKMQRQKMKKRKRKRRKRRKSRFLRRNLLGELEPLSRSRFVGRRQIPRLDRLSYGGLKNQPR